MAEHDPERQRLREWLPLAANQTLAPDLLAQLTSGLERHPDLRHELIWLQTLRHTVQTEPLDPLPAGDLGWSTLERRIAADLTRKRQALTTAPDWSSRVRDWLQAHFGPVLVAACVLMVAQTVLIGTLVRDGSGYEAAGGDPAVPSGAGTVLLHVTVRGDATEQQLRETLQRYNASIVAGPSALGIYTLRVSGADARALAQRLTSEAGSVFDSASPATGD
jgi:hypothetical protein